MSEHDRGKYYAKKKINSRDSSSCGRSFYSSKNTHCKYDKEYREFDKNDIKTKNIKQPTILLKARDPHESRSASPKPHTKESDTSITIVSSSHKEEAQNVPLTKEMTRSTKLLQDGTVLVENVQDFLQENNDFFVIGIVGKQGVGKSTILNLLIQSKITEEVKKELFNFYDNESDFCRSDCEENIQILSENVANLNIKPEAGASMFKTLSSAEIEKNMNVTTGIDFYITDNRIMFLDCQPLGSASVLEDLMQSDNKRLNVISDFLLLENSEEIQGLQLIAFLLSVCHVVILVQDYFFDSNVIRYFQTAEMLKPTISNPEDEYVDHFPHLILLHNKAQIGDFSPIKFRKMQQIYKMMFSKTKCHIDSKLGLSSCRLINSLSTKSCGDPINLYLLPEYDGSKGLYNVHPPLEDLVQQLKLNILGATKYPLTHVQLTEKNWLIYCTKVWEHIKKSNFFVEYNKLLP